MFWTPQRQGASCDARHLQVLWEDSLVSDNLSTGKVEEQDHAARNKDRFQIVLLTWTRVLILTTCKAWKMWYTLCLETGCTFNYIMNGLKACTMLSWKLWNFIQIVDVGDVRKLKKTIKKSCCPSKPLRRPSRSQVRWPSKSMGQILRPKVSSLGGF